MARDYLEDISSQSEEPIRRRSASPFSIRTGERTIRNIAAPHRRGAGSEQNHARQFTGPGSGTERRGGQSKQVRIWIWVAASLAFFVLAVVILLSFRNTTVTVIPVSRTVTFDKTSFFTAYPEGLTAGALSYSVTAFDFEDSAAVPSNGTEKVSERASGTITVYNEYSNSSVKLLKNSRFATPDGLVFRTPEAVVIPGKQGTSPGSISITVFADEAGEAYNVESVSRFTLPGLKSSPDMYTRVYARSLSPMSGGFVGVRPAVPAGALQTARAEVRGRLESKARDSARALASSTATVFPDLMRITYTSLTPTAEAGNGVRIHERAHVEIPVFSSALFAATVARMAGADTESATILSADGDGLAAALYGATSTNVLGKDPIEFTLSGKAQLISNVDADALANALAGRDQAAFQTIIKGFPSIQEARARIEPFWKGAFPQNVSDIHVEVSVPAK